MDETLRVQILNADFESFKVEQRECFAQLRQELKEQRGLINEVTRIDTILSQQVTLIQQIYTRVAEQDVRLREVETQALVTARDSHHSGSVLREAWKFGAGIILVALGSLMGYMVGYK